MRRWTCVSNWIGDSLLRVATADEQLNILRSACALIVQHPEDIQAAGFSLYLLKDQALAHYDPLLQSLSRESYCILPEECDLVAGYFVQITGDGQKADIILHHTCDIADRTLFFTGRCNSNCMMCPYTTKWRERAESTSPAILECYVKLMDPLAPYLCITGGEPTLIGKDFFTLLACIREHFSRTLVHILTNGRTFGNQCFFVEYRLARPSLTLLGIPIYASEAGLHDSITGVRGSFDETILGLDRLYHAGEKIELRIVITAQNITHLNEIAEMIIHRYFRVYMVSLMGLEMMGNAFLNREQVWIPYESVTPLLRNAVDDLVTHGVQTQIYNMPLCKVDRRHWPLCKRSISDDKMAFPPECDLCTMKGICGGFFVANLHVPGINVIPIVG